MSMRLWNVSQATGRPLPEFTDDDVMEFLIHEALTVRGRRMEQAHAERQRKEQERNQRRASHKGLSLEQLARME